MDKSEEIADSEVKVVKEIDKIGNEIIQLLHEFAIDNKTDEKEKFKKFSSLFIKMYNICFDSKDNDKSQLMKLEAEFQKKYNEVQNEKLGSLSKNKVELSYKNYIFVFFIVHIIEDSILGTLHIKSLERNMAIYYFLLKISSIDIKVEIVTSEEKEIDRIGNEMLLLFDKFEMDNKTDKNERFKKFSNLLIKIYNICINNKDQGKSQLMKLETEFQKEYNANENADGVHPRKYLVFDPINFVLVTVEIINNFIREIVKNIKDLEKIMILMELTRKFMLKLKKIVSKIALEDIILENIAFIENPHSNE